MRKVFFVGVVGVFVAVTAVAIAQVLPEARVDNNKAKSEVLVTPGADLEVALPPSFLQSCIDGDLEYGQVSSEPLFDDVELAYPADQFDVVAFGGDVCIRNGSSTDIYGVVATSENVTSNEAGNCPDETESEFGDSTCGPGVGEYGAGELQIAYLAQQNFSDPGADGYCGADVPVGQPVPRVDFDLEEGDGGLVGLIQPGGYCRLSIFILDRRLEPWVSSSDSIEFDLVFVGTLG